MSIETWIMDWGWPAIMLGAAAEGEASVVIGGILAHEKLISAPLAYVSAVLGAVIWDQLLFSIGRHLEDNDHVARLLRRRSAKRALGFIQRHPILFVFGFRFIPGIRIVSPLVAGAARLSHRWFLTLNSLGASAWAAIFFSLGFLLGDAWEGTIAKGLNLNWLAPMLAAGLVVLGGTALLWRKGKRCRTPYPLDAAASGERASSGQSDQGRDGEQRPVGLTYTSAS